MSSLLTSLRGKMKSAGLDGYFIARSDMFGGEEVRAADERLAALTGFTGSAGFALILADKAAVFSDSRYSVQLQRQLDPDHFAGYDMQVFGLSDWLADTSHQLIIGYDGWLVSVSQLERLKAIAPQLSWQTHPHNLVDECWDDRPAYAPRNIWVMADKLAGMSASEKRAKAADKVGQSDAGAQLITAPDSVNWLLNIRGDDLATTPLHLCFALLDKQGEVTLFGADKAALKSAGYDEAGGYHCLDMSALGAVLSRYKGQKITVDKASCPQAVTEMLAEVKVTPHWQADPLQAMKARKTEAEIQGMRAAQISDALAMIAFWHWLDKTADISHLRETDLALKLQQCRAAHPEFICESFPAIVGIGANGAVVHYRAQEGEDAALEKDGVLLIDSGGHYRTGTTDITRTFALGRPDEAAIRASSFVLAAHINLATSRFPAGTNGAQLDAICRQPLWAQGMEYGHGTGHGVGHVLSVHEGPVSISKRGQLPIDAGQILSNEPGYYEEGAFGIRHENLVLAHADEGGFISFETLTLVPFDKGLIDARLLSDEHIGWLNTYHRHIFATLSPFLSDEQAVWLQDKTAPIAQSR